MVYSWGRRVDNVAVEPKSAQDVGPYQRLHEQVSALVISESSADGAVTVDVGADGRLRGLALRERGNAIEDYASMIMACVAAAQARIPGLVEKAVAATVGADDPGANAVLADLREQFPQPEPDTPVTRRRTPRPAPDEDVDDWAGSRIMEDTI